MCQGSRWTRRSGRRRVRSASRFRTRRVAAGVVERPAERGQRTTGCARRTGPGGSARSCRRRGPRPAPRRPARERGGRAPPAARAARPGTAPARRPGGRPRSARSASSSGWTSRPEVGGRGIVPASPTGKPPPTSRVSKPSAARADERQQRQAPADGVAPGVDRAQLRADVEVDPAPRSGPSAPIPRRRRQLGLGHAELRAPAPDGEAGVRLRRDVRVQAEEDVEPRPAAGAEPGAPGDRQQRGGLLGALDGHPAERVAVRSRPDRGPEVGVGLADALERDPIVPDAGPRAAAHSPRRDDVRPEAPAAPGGHDRRDVVRLDRVLAEPRVGEGVAELRRGVSGRRPT